jgi:hypothetical protein
MLVRVVEVVKIVKLFVVTKVMGLCLMVLIKGGRMPMGWIK